MSVKNWELARQDYLLAKQLQGLSPRTLADYDDYAKQFVDYLHTYGLEITTQSIRLFFSTLEVGQVTLGIRIKVLRTFCRWLYAEGYIPEEPMSKIPNPKVPQAVPYVLGTSDVKSLIQVAKNKPPVHFYRNVLSKVPRRMMSEVAQGLKAIHAQETAEEARLKARRLINKHKKGLPGAIAILEAGLEAGPSSLEPLARSLRPWW